jgi:thiol-disulfide isomerase/thioredoxin
VGSARFALARTDADGVATFDWLPVGKNQVAFGLKSQEFSTWTQSLMDSIGTATEYTARLYRMGTIRGRVTMPDGAPVVGVRVMAGGRGKGSDSAGELTRTGADGSYAMTVPSEMAYLVAVEDADWAAPTRDGVVVREGGPAAEADFRLERGALIRGRVTLGPDRRPAPGRLVSLSEQGGPVPADLKAAMAPHQLSIPRTTLTGADGSFAFRVPRGTYMIRGPERTMRLETVQIADQAELVRDFHMIRPEQGPISGRVVLAGEPGQGIAGAKVQVVASVDPRAQMFLATTDADGRFRDQRQLTPTVFRAASPDGSLVGVADVDADAAEVIIPIGPTASASGRLLDDLGRPVAGRPIECYLERGRDFSVSNTYEATTDALGQFTLSGLVVDQRYRVRVRTEANRSEDLTTVVPREPGLIEMGALQIGAAVSFRDDAPRPGAVAPPIRGTDLNGKPIAADDFRGKVVLLTFWGTWCGPCLDELPKLQAVHDAFGNDPRFAMVSLSVDASIDAPRRFVAGRKLPGLQGFAGPRVPGSPSDDFGVRGVPATILLGPDGKVISKGMRGDAIKAAVAEALGKAP